MQPPSVPELLRSWEVGLSLPPHERALLLLQVTHPATPADDLAQLSIGRRDALLLRVRESLFGPQFTSQAVCPHCGEQLEVNFDVPSILIDEPVIEDAQLCLDFRGHNIVFRLPNSQDLAAVLAEPDISARQSTLLRRCICPVSGNGTQLTTDQLPIEVAESIESRMAELDPQANVELDLLCPGCRNCWLAPFEIVSFLWSEINAWAKRMLQEVHLLAISYGWSEHDILSMHPVRRQLYLQMVCR